MPHWLNPLALAGLVAALGPVAVHLLSRRRAARLPFASIRFLRVASTAAVRLQRPSDIWLLLLRVAIVCGAAGALAQPLFVTTGRRAAWDRRISRAIVVDRSASMAAAGPRATAAALAEAQGAAHAVRLDVDDLRRGLLQAADVLSAVPPSRREIVMISDFQQGALGPADLAAVPAAVGLRFVKVGEPQTTALFRGEMLLAAPGVVARVQRIQTMPDSTAVRLTVSDAHQAGLRLIGAAASGDALLRAVAQAGAPAPSVDQPIAIAFEATSRNVGNPADSGNPADLRNPGNASLPAWMLRTILMMRRDPALADAAREHRRQGHLPTPFGFVIARDSNDLPIVAAAARATELLLHVGAAASDYLAAATLRSALIARRGRPDWTEQEVAHISTTQLAQWTREPPPIEMARLQDLSDRAPGDSRWVWIAVLCLLALETVLRSRQRRSARDVHADAA